MRLKQITSYAISQMLGWLLWRTLLGTLVGLFTLVALFQFTAAGMLALELRVGALYAHLIIAGVFTSAAFITVGFMMVTRPRRLLDDSSAGVLSKPRNVRIAMLAEALMLGYALARKKPRE